MAEPTFGDELRRLREQRGLSLTKFAHLVHYDTGYLSKIENGLKPPTATLATACDAALKTGGILATLVPASPARESHPIYEIRIPVVIDGRLMLLPVNANGQLSGTLGGNHDQANPKGLCEKLSRGLPGSSAAMIVSGEGTAWQWELPGGRSFAGTALPLYLGEASWSTQGTAVFANRQLRPLSEFVWSSPRGMIVAGAPGDSGTSPVLWDAVAARKQIHNRVVEIPQAFQVDDLTLGILWALSNLDEALLNDDANLAQARQCFRGPTLDKAEVPGAMLTELSGVSHLWLGSDSCARFIISSTRDFSTQPAFWTREQRGEDASTWLFFRHKLDYLLATSQRFTEASGSAGRTFCVPEHAVLDSLPSERVLLLLAAALMESLGIRTQFCPDPALSEVDGFVLAPGSEAVIANWVRTDGHWHVDRTRSISRVRAFGDVIAHARAHGLCAAASPAPRLAALADYLGIDWTWLTRRCRALAEYSCRDFARPRSRLLSTDGIDAACRYVASLHDEPASVGG